MKTQIKNIQSYVKVIADGDFGPKTITAVAKLFGCGPTIKAIQKSVGVKEDGELGPITVNTILNKLNISPLSFSAVDKLIDIARSQLFIRESSKNQGDGIKKLWDATSYPEGFANREPYCAAGMVWTVKESQIFSENDRPKSASAFSWETWADSHLSKVKIDRSPELVSEGDIIVFKFSHIGLATSDSDKKGDFDTVEFNTNKAGEREGDGCFEKSRNISSVRSTISVI